MKYWDLAGLTDNTNAPTRCVPRPRHPLRTVLLRNSSVARLTFSALFLRPREFASTKLKFKTVVVLSWCKRPREEKNFRQKKRRIKRLSNRSKLEEVNLYGFTAGFAGSYTYNIIQCGHKYLAVPDLAGVGSCRNRFDYAIQVFIGNCDFNFYFR